MGKEVQTQEWYKHLVDQCKAIIIERTFRSRIEIVEGKHELGELICTDKNFKKLPGSKDANLKELFDNIGIGRSDGYYCVQFYEKYPKLSTLVDRLEKQEVVWYKIRDIYLPAPKVNKAEIEYPKGKYQIIYCDPPWDYGNTQFIQAEKGIKGKITSAAELHYPVMSVEELKNMKVADLADENCLLFMWSSSPHLEFAIQIINAWGFEYKTIAFVWDKQKLNPSAYTMSQVEICLVAKKGSIPEPRGKRNIRQFISEERREHSQKPIEARKRIEQMFPTQKKIELFAREKPKGWDVFGNEV